MIQTVVIDFSKLNRFTELTQEILIESSDLTTTDYSIHQEIILFKDTLNQCIEDIKDKKDLNELKRLLSYDIVDRYVFEY